MDGSRFGIVRSVNQTTDTGVNQGSRTHGARLNCSKQLAVSKTVVGEILCRLTQGDDFGVGGGIVVGEVAVPASSEDAATTDDDGSDGDFAGFESALSRAQRFLHPEFVGPGFVRLGLKLIRSRLVARRQSSHPSPDMWLAEASLRESETRSWEFCRIHGWGFTVAVAEQNARSLHSAFHSRWEWEAPVGMTVCERNAVIVESLRERQKRRFWTQPLTMGNFVLLREGSVKSVAVTWGVRLPSGHTYKT